MNLMKVYKQNRTSGLSENAGGGGVVGPTLLELLAN
jgi:hypothetical protein